MGLSMHMRKAGDPNSRTGRQHRPNPIVSATPPLALYNDLCDFAQIHGLSLNRLLIGMMTEVNVLFKTQPGASLNHPVVKRIVKNARGAA